MVVTNGPTAVSKTLPGLSSFYRFPGRKVVSSKAALVFRVAAVAEAFSWAGLLIGMYFKYGLHSAHEGGVPVLGMVHGIVFVVYVLTSLLVFKPLAWKPKTLALALLSSVPPLLTWWFEKWALRTGRLDGPERLTYGGTGLFVREPVSA
jgi:integral membrane protein